MWVNVQATREIFQALLSERVEWAAASRSHGPERYDDPPPPRSLVSRGGRIIRFLAALHL